MKEIFEHPFLNNGQRIPTEMHIDSLKMRPNKTMIDMLNGKESTCDS